MPLLVVEKLRRRIPEIVAAALRGRVLVDGVLTCGAPGAAAESAMAAPPARDATIWQALRFGACWGGRPGTDPDAILPPIGEHTPPLDGGSNHWLWGRLCVPAAWRGHDVLLALDWEGQGLASVEAIVYLDGQALAGIDEFHRAVLLPAAVHAGEHDVFVRCYVPRAQRFGGLFLQVRDPTIFHLGHMMQALLGVVESGQEGDASRYAILEYLDRAYALLDLCEGWQSGRFAASAQAAFQLLCDAMRTLPVADAGVGKSPLMRRPRVIATGHAHLDVAWLWPLWRTRQKVAHTVATALHLMERYPTYHFSMSQPQVYQYLQQDDPALYARLMQRVAEGRFEPVGMMWLEADCNIPSGESLVRQLTQGARFFNDAFGELQHVVWLPDVFGYSAALPQLMRGCGIDCFMTTKISWNQFNRMPVDTFRWRGIDGSEVLTHFVTATDDPVGHPADAQSYTYVGQMTAGQVVGTWNHYRQKAINTELLYIYGWGDGGGGPTEGMLEAAQVFHDLPGFPRVEFGRVDRFFADLYARVWDDPRLPIWSGELYLEYHRGTYTSQSRTKQANRAAELLYREAEWLNAWAQVCGAANQQARLDEGWRLILLNQFHDILPGSSISQVYADSAAQYAEVQRIGQAVRAAQFAAVVSAAADDSADVVVVNSLPWERQDVVHVGVGVSAHAFVDHTGAALPTQVVEEPDGQAALLIALTTPSYGYTTLRRVATASDSAPKVPVGAGCLRPQMIISRSSIDNGELRLELDDHGEIVSLYDRRYAREVVAKHNTMNQLVAYEDRPLAWDAWDIDVFYEQKPYPVRDIVGWQVVEEGPLRATLAMSRRIGSSVITQRISLWRDSRRVDIVTQVDWQERQMLLRALFPLAINARQATCEIQFGAVERPTHRNTSWDWARFEVCAQRWVDLSEGDYGVALLNNGKYGYSLHHNVVGLSLLKGAVLPDPDADRGRHCFTYSLFPHAGDWRVAQVPRRAYELNAPLLAMAREVIAASGPTRTSVQCAAQVSPSTSFLSSPTEHIVVETIKVADDGDGLIVRLYEAHNQRGPAQVTFARPVLRAVEVDLLERVVGPVAVVGSEISFDVRPFEVKTLRVWLQ